MRLNILKIRIIINVLIVYTFFSCKEKNDLESQITIKMTTIDYKTKQPRTGTFDTVEIMKEKARYLMKNFTKIEECVTDSTGSFKVKINPDTGYKFILRKKGFYGSESFGRSFSKEQLKDGQEINIQVMHLEN